VPEQADHNKAEDHLAKHPPQKVQGAGGLPMAQRTGKMQKPGLTKDPVMIGNAIGV